jgi:hypothetical protein
MGRPVEPDAPAATQLDECQLALLYNGMERLLALPLTDDLVLARRCREAAERGRRAARQADGWPGRVEAMAEAGNSVFGAHWSERQRRYYERREPFGDPGRYLRRAERAFEGGGGS